MNSGTQSSTSSRRPLLSYLGGKFRIAPWVVSHLPTHRCYVEPFGGGGAVLQAKRRSVIEVYNDLDDEIVNVFRCLRHPGLAKRLHKLLELTPYAAAEIAECYQPTTDKVELARRVICRSFFLLAPDSVFKLDKTMRRGPGRSHAGSWANYVEGFEQFHKRLRSVTIENMDALKLIDIYDSPETLFYVDPPYVASTRTSGAKYRHEYTDQQHRELAARLHGVKGSVVLSGYRCGLYDELYSGWTRFEKETRNVANTKAMESLWLSPRAEQGRAALGV